MFWFFIKKLVKGFFENLKIFIELIFWISCLFGAFSIISYGIGFIVLDLIGIDVMEYLTGTTFGIIETLKFGWLCSCLIYVIVTPIIIIIKFWKKCKKEYKK